MLKESLVMKLSPMPNPALSFKKLALTTALCVGLAGVTACEMADNVAATKSTSEDILNATNKMAGITTQMERVTCETKRDIEQGSAEPRSNALKHLDEAPTFEEKLGYAGLYVRAFEFQLWQDNCPMDKAELYETDMDGLFRTLRGKLHHIVLLKDELRALGVEESGKQPYGDCLDRERCREELTAVREKLSEKEDELHNAQQSLRALVTALHRVNKKQEADREETEPQSILHLIVRALEMHKTNVPRNERPQWVRHILQNYDILGPLMVERLNALLALNISRLQSLDRAALTIERILDTEKMVEGTLPQARPTTDLVFILTGAMNNPAWTPRFPDMIDDEVEYNAGEIVFAAGHTLKELLPALNVLPTHAINPSLAVAFGTMQIRKELLAKDPADMTYAEKVEANFYQILAQAQLVKLQ